MSEQNKPLLIEGPDGRLYEIPQDRLAEFAVPGARVLQLRKQQAAATASGHSRFAPDGSLPPGDGAQPGAHVGGGDVQGYHMSMDSGIPVNHTELLWGDYVDKQGNPGVGFHSHDPVTGNAQ